MPDWGCQSVRRERLRGRGGGREKGQGEREHQRPTSEDPSLGVVPVIIRCTNCHILFNDQENGPDPPTPFRTLPAGYTHVGLSGLACSVLVSLASFLLFPFEFRTSFEYRSHFNKLMTGSSRNL